jgi:hypothetical protein
MLVNVHFPTTVGVRLAGTGMPIDEAVQRILACAQSMRAAVEKMPGRSESFGQKLVEAVKARSRGQPCFSSFIAESASGESFGEELKKAVEKKQGGLPTQKQHGRWVERERERYKEQG